jgi:hypothetical protein
MRIEESVHSICLAKKKCILKVKAVIYFLPVLQVHRSLTPEPDLNDTHDISIGVFTPLFRWSVAYIIIHLIQSSSSSSAGFINYVPLPNQI